MLKIRIENIPECVFAIDEGLEMLFPLESVSTTRDDTSEIEEMSARSENIASISRETIKKEGFHPTRKFYSPPPPDYLSKIVSEISVSNGALSSSALSPNQNKSEPQKLAGLFGLSATTVERSSQARSSNTGTHLDYSGGHGRRLASTAPMDNKQIFFLTTNQSCIDDYLIAPDGFRDNDSGTKNGKYYGGSSKGGIVRDSLLHSTR